MEYKEATLPAAETSSERNRTLSTVKFVVFSLIGVVFFFVDITIGGVKTVPMQHLMDLAYVVFAPVIPYYALLNVILGAVLPIATKTWNKSAYDIIFTVAKCIGVVIGFMAVFGVGPELLMQPDYIPFLWDSIVVPIAVMIPIAGLAFVMLINYGVVEFMATFLHKVMRKIWKTPGESAVDAIVSFTDGYAMAVIVTNNLYKRGIYTAKESVIIATGFSTVSISFLLIIANTLEFMEYWGIFLLACLVVTFAVTAITARIYPISKMPDTYYDKPAEKAPEETGNMLVRAFRNGVNAAHTTKPLGTHLKNYYLGEAVQMSSAVTASILSIGLIGILIANFTPLFDFVGYIFYPVTSLLRIPEPMLAAKAAAIEITEMFLPSLLVIGTPIVTRFVTAVTSVSAVLFFSASIPALLATDIPIKMKDIILIWIERTVLSLILSTVIAVLIF